MGRGEVTVCGVCMELYMCGVEVGVSRLCVNDRNGSFGFSVADFDIFTGQKVMHTCVPLCVPFFLPICCI